MLKHALASLLVFVSLAAAASAQSLPADEQAFIDKHLADVITITPKRLDDPAVTKVFSAPLYMLTIVVRSADEDNHSTQQQLAARIGDKLVAVSTPSTDGDCPAIQKMIDPKFTLETDADAKTLQAALDVLYPPMMSSDKKAVAFRHKGREWSFIRGLFFDKPMGFIFITDPAGKITAVKYALKLS